jgi:hypothetical protein
MKAARSRCRSRVSPFLLAAIAALGSATAQAQSHTPPDSAARRRPADSAYVLAPVVVSVDTAKLRGPSLLERMRQQDAEIGRLQTRLTYLKTTVTDSLQHAITSADSTTATRLVELEAAAGRARPVAPPDGTR